MSWCVGLCYHVQQMGADVGLCYLRHDGNWAVLMLTQAT